MFEIFKIRIKDEKYMLPVCNKNTASKKEFIIMRKLIDDAEKYENEEEYGVSEQVLKSLIIYIEQYNKL